MYLMFRWILLRVSQPARTSRAGQPLEVTLTMTEILHLAVAELAALANAYTDHVQKLSENPTTTTAEVVRYLRLLQKVQQAHVALAAYIALSEKGGAR
jgi:hypothetical protein